MIGFRLKLRTTQNIYEVRNKNIMKSPWQRGLVVSCPPATEETGAMGREIESRQSMGW
jgi:hypothetical protein